MQSLTAVVLGATGLIGEQVVQQLLNDPVFSKIRILVRREVELSHPNLEVEVIDFDNITEYQNKLGRGDCVFCCIGTTNKKVKGDNKAYRNVDFNMAVNGARFAKIAGFTKYLLVSAVGADTASLNFYLKLKGEVEKEIRSLDFVAFHAFRPGILLGKRKKLRIREALGKVVIFAVSMFLVGPLKKYRAIDAVAVAKALVIAAKSNKTGNVVHHYREMIDPL